MSAPFTADTLRSLPGAEEFVLHATSTGRAVVEHTPGAPTRELALAAGAWISAWRNRPLLVVADPGALVQILAAAAELDVRIDGLVTPLRFRHYRGLVQQRAVLVVVSDRPAETSPTGQAIVSALAGAELAVMRESARGNPAQMAAVTDRPHATYRWPA